jgi:hypothetical protein
MKRTSLHGAGLAELLEKFSGLRLRPTTDGNLAVAGTLEFSAHPRDRELVSDCYEISISVPTSFPKDIPLVRETAGRIPSTFHKLASGHLCLGSPTRLRLMLAEEPSLFSFVERCVIPYLYGYSCYEGGGNMPFDELAHGVDGLRDDLADLLGIQNDDTLIDFVRALSMKKRKANKRICPCRSGLRVGRCHNRKLNKLRDALGRRWFASMIR